MVSSKCWSSLQDHKLAHGESVPVVVLRKSGPMRGVVGEKELSESRT